VRVVVDRYARTRTTADPGATTCGLTAIDNDKVRPENEFHRWEQVKYPFFCRYLSFDARTKSVFRSAELARQCFRSFSVRKARPVDFTCTRVRDLFIVIVFLRTDIRVRRSRKEKPRNYVWSCPCEEFKVRN